MLYVYIGLIIHVWESDLTFVNHYLSILVKRRYVVVLDAELCAVIVASASVEVNVYLAIADGLDETLLIEIGKFKIVVVQKVLLTFASNGFGFYIGSHIKTVLQFGSCLVEEVVKSPIRYDVKVLGMSDTFIDTFKPFRVSSVGVLAVEEILPTAPSFPLR